MKREVIPGGVLAVVVPTFIVLVVVPTFIVLWLAAAPAEPEFALAAPDDENSLTISRSGASLLVNSGNYISSTYEVIEPTRFVIAARADGGWWEIACIDGRSPEFEAGKARCP